MTGTVTPSEEPAGLDKDLRRFSRLSPLEQLERLEADGRRIKQRESEMRAAQKVAESIASIGKPDSRPQQYQPPKLSEHEAEELHRRAQAQRLK